MQDILTLMGLHEYLYDPDENPDGLFKYFTVPEDTFNRELLINTILLRGGEFEILYPNPVILMPLIGHWCSRWSDTMTRWWTAFHMDYDPIANYDRHEEWTDESSGTSSGSSSGSNSDTSSESLDTTETKTVSAYNSNAFQNDEKITRPETRSNSSSGTNSGSTESEYENSSSHTGHLYGNIGVTSSQQLIESEIELYRMNLYDQIADIFLHDFVIPVC